MGYGEGIDPKSFHEHYPFKNYFKSYGCYWCEDEGINNEALHLDKIDNLTNIVGWLCVPLFILFMVAIPIVGIWSLIILGLFIVDIIIAAFNEVKQEERWCKLLDRFKQTTDYKFQVAYYKAEKARLKQLKLYEETKDINILIELFKQWIDYIDTKEKQN